MAVDPEAIPLLPRLYQEQLIQDGIKRNIIVRLDTGQGKTLIAVLAIRHFMSIPRTEHVKTISVFLAPTVALVFQQAEVLRSGTNLKVKLFVGSMGVDFWKRERWTSELEEADVVVCTPAIWVNVLTHAYWKMSAISIIVFDEAHHASKGHPYAQIMQKYHEEKATPLEHDLPRIIGLTASPVWTPKTTLKTLRILEKTMDAVVVEVEPTGGPAARPIERCLFYSPATSSDPLPLLSFEEVLVASMSLLDESVLEQVTAMKKFLGTFAAHLLAIHLLERERDEFEQTKEQERELHDSIFRLISLLPTAADKANVSPKVSLLINLLHQHADQPNFYAMIFVERRIDVFILEEILKRATKLKGWMRPAGIVGHGSEGSGMAVKEQESVVADMRIGDKVNVLVATSVAEEGLDFPACNLVIKFDPLKTLKGYIQSRGRARASSSEYIVLCERGSSDEAQYRNFSKAEPEVKELYKNRPEAVHEDEPEVEGLPTYRVSTTDANLDHARTVSLLAEFCSLLQTDEFSGSQQPVFDIVGSGRTWRATVELPIITAIFPLRSFQGDVLLTKRAAKQSAAYKVCVELHQKGALDDYLLPFRPYERLETPDEDDEEDVAYPFSSLTTDENHFGDPRVEGAEIWLHVIEVFNPTRGASVVVGLVTGRPLTSVGGEFGKLYGVETDSPTPHNLRIIDSRRLELAKESLEHLDTFNRTCQQLVINRRLEKEDPLYLLWSPLTITSESGTYDIDWNLVENAFYPVNLDDTLTGTLIVVPYRRPRERIVTLIEVRDGITDTSPCDFERDGFLEPAAKPHKRYIHYYDFFRLHYDFQESDELSGQPILRLSTIGSSSRNYLDPLEPPLQRVSKVVHFPLGMCRRTLLSKEWLDLFALTPFIARRLHDQLAAAECIRALELPSMSLDLLRLALTPSSAGTGEDYQSLEFLGDSLLQLCTSMHVFQENPTWEENRLSAGRQSSVSNRFLRRQCIEKGVYRHLLASRVRVDVGWTPPTPHETNNKAVPDDKQGVGPKTLSDMIEAIVGAAYLSGGLQMVLDAGKSLGLTFNSSINPSRDDDPASRTSTAPPNLRVIEEKIGYTFLDPMLLLRAVTHRSHSAGPSPSYERLEWLGDALLEYWATHRLWQLFPHAPPGTLSSLRGKLVSNPTISFWSATKFQLHRSILHSSINLTPALQRAAAEAATYRVEDVADDLTWLWDPPKVLGDLLEAVLGAVFIDSNYGTEEVFRIFENINKDLLALLPNRMSLDPHSRLFSLGQRLQCSHLKVKLSHHDATVHASVRFHGEEIAKSTAPGKSLAKQIAARAALDAFEGSPLADRCNCALVKEEEKRYQGEEKRVARAEEKAIANATGAQDDAETQ